MDKRTYNDRKEYYREYYRKYYHSNSEYKEKQRERTKLRGLENRKKYLEWKASLRCSRCGESEPCCLEFHHTNPEDKDFTVSQLSQKSMRVILKEAEKCEIVCSNCHKKIHAGIVEWHNPGLPS